MGPAATTSFEQKQKKMQRDLFKNPVLNKLSKANSFFVIGQILIIAIATLLYGIIAGKIVWYKIIPMYFLGILFFTLIEYLMHRYLYHLPPTTKKRENFQYLMHGYHHDNPKDKSALAMPPLIVILYAFIAFVIFYFIMGKLTYAFLPGVMTGYAAYLFIHYIIHAYRPPKNFFKKLWIHHSIHHYQQTEKAFGVSSPLWDYVFGTMPLRKNKK